VSRRAQFQCPLDLLSAFQGLYSIALLSRDTSKPLFWRCPASGYVAHWSLRFLSKSLQYMRMLVEVVCEGEKEGLTFSLLK